MENRTSIPHAIKHIVDNKELMRLAITAMQNSYSPYSKFTVGAALLTTSGEIYLGCNIENASFTATVCAERVAMATAVAAGEQHFEAIAVAIGASLSSMPAPCGICRQFMSEFGLNLRVIMEFKGTLHEFPLKELLPHAFVTFNS